MIKKYSMLMGISLLCLVIAYQVSWIHSVRKNVSKQQQEQENREELLQSEFSDDYSESGNNIAADTFAVHDHVEQSAQIILESYDEDGNLINREVTVPNAKLAGLTRLEVMMYANDYKKNAPKAELQQGLQRMVVKSFSPESVTLVKYYGAPIDEPGYWIAVRDNIIIVYTEDKSEIYEFTNIELWQLPLTVQSDLVDGIYVENERELFDFLQTYSS